jgi:hypothetical protein
MIREAKPTETAAMKNGRTKLSPKELAAQWGTTTKTILALIHSGALGAIDISVKSTPRFLIDLADIAIFEERRTVQPPEERPRTRRRRSKKRDDDGTVKYF